LALPALLIAAALSAPVASAAAQLGPPLRLVQPPPSAVAPQIVTPSAPDAGLGGQPLPPDVQATPLAPVDPAWAGSLPASEGALPESLWQGTPKAFLIAALPQLQPSLSPTLQDLARRLMLSNAVAPFGADRSEEHTSELQSRSD